MDVLFGSSLRNLHLEVAPAPSFVQPEDRNQQSARPDEEERTGRAVRPSVDMLSSLTPDPGLLTLAHESPSTPPAEVPRRPFRAGGRPRTVRGAGQAVPENQPPRPLPMVSRLLGRPLEEASMADTSETNKQDREKIRGSEEDLVDASKDEFDDEPRRSAGA